MNISEIINKTTVSYFLLVLSGSILCHVIEKLVHIVIYFFLNLGYLLGFLAVESNCADTTVKDENHTMNETILLFQEEGFVLEPVDDTGQNLISFL